MEINQVKIFITVAKVSSFSKAADLLYISQPTVTNNIKKLENELGIHLFYRNHRSVSLTESGSLFYKHAMEIINAYEKADHFLTGYKKDMQGSLEFFASTIPEQYLLPNVIAAFRKKYPLTRIVMKHLPSESILERLLSGHINFGFVGVKSSKEGLDYIDLYKERLVLITPADRVFDKNPVEIIDILGETIITREERSGTRRIFEQGIRSKNMDIDMFQGKIVSESLEAIKRMVSLGVGVSMVPYVSVKDDMLLGKYNVYEIGDLSFHRVYSMAFRKNRILSPIEEEFKVYIEKWKWAV
jgi:DNA-binding transcriptional LysR family regulator